MKISLALILFLFGWVNVSSAQEKSVEELLRGAAMGRAVLSEIETYENNHREKTGKDLKVVLLARPSLKVKNVKLLKDSDKNGEIINYDQIIKGESFNYGIDTDQSISVRQKLMANAESLPSDMPTYNHMGFAIKTRGQWRVYHMLPVERNGKVTPTILSGGIGWFFANHADFDTVQITFLPEEIQDRIADAVLYTHSPFVQSRLGADTYRVYSSYKTQTESSRSINAFSWILEILAYAISEDEMSSREEAISFLLSTGYEGTRLLSNGRVLAEISMASTSILKTLFVPELLRVNTKEQPYAHFGMVEVHTFLSVNNYLDSLLADRMTRVELEVPLLQILGESDSKVQ